MLRIVPLDHLDLSLLHALRVDGRVSFALTAEVLGTSQQTITRRYRKLREEHGLRIVGMTSPGRLGQVQWLVRLRATPDAAQRVAESLAARDDTTWVQLTSGGTEIVCLTRSDGAHAPLLRQLPRAQRVLSVSAHCLLHVFVGGPIGWSGTARALTGAQIERLTPPEVSEVDEPVDLSGDRRLLAVLREDGRATFARLAAATGQAESTVRRRLNQLRRTGVLYFDVDVDPAALGIGAHAMLWTSVRQSELVSVAQALARRPEVAFVAATTGPANLVATVLCQDVSALYTYLTGEIGSIPAIGHVETAPVIHTVKRAAVIGKDPA